MKFQVTYKHDLIDSDGAGRWCMDVATDPDEFTTTLNRLMNDARTAGHQITRIVIDRPEPQTA
jgi:hypothetical protein